MAIMLKAEGDQVYVTNFVIKAKVVSREHQRQLKYSKVQGPRKVSQSFLDAIKDA